MRTPEEQQKLHSDGVARQNVRNQIVIEGAAKILFTGAAATRDEIIDRLRAALGIDMVDEAIDDLTAEWALEWIAERGPKVFK